MLNLWQAEMIKISRLRLVFFFSLLPAALGVAIGLLSIVINLASSSRQSEPGKVNFPGADLGSGMFGLANSIMWANIGGLYTIVMVIIGSTIIANEYGWGTIKMVATREASRVKIVLAKVLALFTFGVISWLSFAIGAIIAGILLRIFLVEGSFSFKANDLDTILKGLSYGALSFIGRYVWGLLAVLLGMRFRSVGLTVLFFIFVSGVDSAATAFGTILLQGQEIGDLPGWLGSLLTILKFITPGLITFNSNQLTGTRGLGAGGFVVDSIPVWQSWLVLAIWGGAALLLTIQIFTSRDLAEASSS